MRTELNDFNSFLGIPNTNYNKKAHMTEAEISANDVETQSLVDIMLETVKNGLDDVNRIYGLNIQIRKRYPAEITQTVDSGGVYNGNV